MCFGTLPRAETVVRALLPGGRLCFTATHHDDRRRLLLSQPEKGSRRHNSILPRYSQWRTDRLPQGALRGRRKSLRLAYRGVSLWTPLSKPVRAVVSNVTSSVDEGSSGSQKSVENVIHFYRIPLIQESATAELLKSVQAKISNKIVGLKTEQCYNVGLNSGLSSEKLSVLKWLL
ncbi:hypothetical protein RJ640_008626 [Escallonia rubra]|uniref:Uncharacterized protein n=1 Tax=Escallonia rubra TaxID=112253 RepID=A0AA88QMI5_9ASTE|nr:hypothetical protein RJ640_008626 [Escallonia rubra]